MLAPKIVAGFVVVAGFTVAANLMLKLGAGASEAERVFGLLGWRSMAGLALFCCGGIVYASLLRHVPLNTAQVFTSALRPHSPELSSIPPKRLRPRITRCNLDLCR